MYRVGQHYKDVMLLIAEVYIEIFVQYNRCFYKLSLRNVRTENYLPTVRNA